MTSLPIIIFLFTIPANNRSADLILIVLNLSVTGAVSKFLISLLKSKTPAIVFKELELALKETLLGFGLTELFFVKSNADSFANFFEFFSKFFADAGILTILIS